MRDDKTIILKKVNSDGSTVIKELRPSMFPDADSFQEALDFWSGEGWEEQS